MYSPGQRYCNSHTLCLIALEGERGMGAGILVLLEDRQLDSNRWAPVTREKCE